MSFRRVSRASGVSVLSGLALLLSGAPSANTFADTALERLQRRDFPSVFQAWSPVENVPGEGELDGAARHDLFWGTLESYGLQWDGPSRGLATAFVGSSVTTARERREELLQRNPDMVLLAELRYRDGPPGFLPETHPWWLRDANGERVLGWAEGNSYRLDLGNPEFIAHVIARAGALIDTGAIDGLLLDVWNEFEQPYVDDRAALIRGVRAAVGEALIVVNTNNIKAPRSAPYINGLYMENDAKRDAATWANYRDIMDWAGNNLRTPAFTAFETWYARSRQSPGDLRQMRATTALSLVASEGFALFGDPNPLPGSDHLHDWYPFWDVDLGRPTGVAVDLVGGAVRRDYTEGVAVYSPPDGSTGTIEFERRVRSVNTGMEAFTHPIGEFDGDLFLYVDAIDGSGETAIGTFAPPTNVKASQRIVVSVPFVTDVPADLVVSFQDTDDDWATAGFTRKVVAPGATTLRVPVDIDANAAPGDAYAWTAWLVPPGGKWSERLDSATVQGVALARYRDEVVAIESIRSLAPGQRFTVDVDITAAAGRTVLVSLQNTERGWADAGFARVNVASGASTATVTLDVAQDAVPGGGYALTAYLSPRNGNWENRLDVSTLQQLRVTPR